ncbi:sigma-E factor negative regulatory protein [Ottowia sp.]|uniref:sigma-E factor negative regulatory protein n=1 Tax=Ottowia sp. TaxID=1898956 RepID=UPI003A8B366C
MPTKAVEYKESISALMDGQLQAAEQASVWHAMDGEEARDCWAMYHLIGDVLRSPDLAHGQQDRDLAARVCHYLQAESVPKVAVDAQTVVMTKTDHHAANDGVFRWKMLAGVASVAAVTAIGWGMWGATVPLQDGGAQLAQAPTVRASGQVLALAAAPQVDASQPVSPNNMPPMMLRDQRLDELLAAHRSVTGASTLGGASGFLRNATFEGAGR